MYLYIQKLKLAKEKLMIKVFLIFLLNILGITHADIQCINSNSAIATKTNHLQDSSNGTVIDSKTDLIWKKCSEGQVWNSNLNSCDGAAKVFNWQQALQQVQVVNLSDGENNLGVGYTDWRLPNIKELYSIVEPQCYYPSINLAVFPSTPTEGDNSVFSLSLFWTSTQRSNNNGRTALVVNFGDGLTAYIPKTNTFADVSYQVDPGHRALVRGFFHVRLVRTR